MSVGQSTFNQSNYLTAPSPTWTSITVSGWIQVKDLTATGAFPAFFAVLDNASSYSWIGYDAAAASIKIWNSTSGFSSAVIGSLAANDWIYVALIHNGTTQTGYASKNNGTSAVQSVTLPARTELSLRALQDGGLSDSLGGFLCYARIWNVALSQAQLDTERGSATAVVTSGLVSDSPLPNTSTLGAWSITGSLSNGSNSPYLGPQITAQPVQQSAASGSTATFSVTATGIGTVSYLWYKNGASTGTTTSSYTTPTLSISDNGNSYYCAVTDSNGTINTATVYLFIIGESSGDGDKINSAWFFR